MSFNVTYTRKSLRALEKATDWVAQLGAATLQKWQRRYQTAYASLESDPHRFAAADDCDIPGLELRQLTFGQKKHKYRVYFTIAGDAVTIHAIRHAAQDSLSEDDL